MQPRARRASANATISRTCCVAAAVCHSRCSHDLRARKGGGAVLFLMVNWSYRLTNHGHPGRRALHVQKHRCASCGYPRAKMRSCRSSCSLLGSSLSRVLHEPIQPPRMHAARRSNLAQTTGARRPSAGGPRALAACATSRRCRAATATDSARACPRAHAARLSRRPSRRCGTEKMRGGWSSPRNA